MRILLTGATGFLGSYFLRRLATEPVTVAVLVRPESDGWRITPPPFPVTRVEADLCRIEQAGEAIHRFQPEALVHCAWTGAVGRFRNDFFQIEQNLTPGLKLLRLAGQAGCKTFLGVGSQAEYGPANRPLNENAPVAPSTLYGTAKLSFCWLARQLCRQENLRFLWLRLFSTYGPMDDPHWLIPSVIGALLRHERPALTPAGQIWDFLYAEDAADAFWQVLRTPRAEGIFNLGSGQPRPLRDVIELIRDRIQPQAPLGFGELEYRPDQVMHLEADITRLRLATGWTPRTPLESGLEKTIAWHRSQLA